MTRLMLVGIYPPPYGGVSIHVRRLLTRILRSGMGCVLFDTSDQPKRSPAVVHSSWRRTFWRLLVTNRCVVHFHNFSIRNTFYFFLLSFRHRTLLTLHNERFLDELQSHGRVVYALAAYFLNRLDCIIVDNEKCRDLATRFVRDTGKLVVIPTYLAEVDVPPLSNAAIQRLRDGHRFLIGSNAFQIAFHQGVDLYGLDQLVELMHRLVTRHGLDVALVFLLPNIGDHAYFAELQRQVEQLGLADRLQFITEPLDNAVSLWQCCDLVIRATNTDLNSLTVSESIAVGTPVIASDCAARHPAAVLFSTRDLDDLERRTVDILNHLDDHRRRVADVESLDNGDRLLALYDRLGVSSLS